MSEASEVAGDNVCESCGKVTLELEGWMLGDDLNPEHQLTVLLCKSCSARLREDLELQRLDDPIEQEKAGGVRR